MPTGIRIPGPPVSGHRPVSGCRWAARAAAATGPRRDFRRGGDRAPALLPPRRRRTPLPQQPVPAAAEAGPHGDFHRDVQPSDDTRRQRQRAVPAAPPAGTRGGGGGAPPRAPPRRRRTLPRRQVDPGAAADWPRRDIRRPRQQADPAAAPAGPRRGGGLPPPRHPRRRRRTAPRR